MIYKYIAKTEDSKKVSGVMEAKDEAELQSRLKAEGKFLVKSSNASIRKKTNRLTATELSDFSRNISKMSASGMTITRALKLISEDETVKPTTRTVYGQVLGSIYSGKSLSEALADQNGSFPMLLINMFKSAENAGNLSQTAQQLAVYYEKEYRLRKKLSGALLYPKILVVLIVLVVAVVMGYVLPQFKSLFEHMEKLPVATRMVLGLSSFVTEKWYLIIIVAVLIYIVLKIAFSIPACKKWRDKQKLYFPVIGKQMRIVYTARFARTFSSLYNAGLPIINCLNVAKDTIGNSYIESKFDKAIADIKAGATLSEAMAEIDGFTTKLSGAVMVGEETGELYSMLNTVSEQLEYESEIAINRLVSLIEPVMIVIMALVVGFIMLSVIQPIYGSYEQIAGSMEKLQ